MRVVEQKCWLARRDGEASPAVAAAAGMHRIACNARWTASHRAPHAIPRTTMQAQQRSIRRGRSSSAAAVASERAKAGGGGGSRRQRAREGRGGD